MAKSRLPKSLRKHIRSRKAEIRSSVLDLAEQDRKIAKLYEELGISVSRDKKPQEAKPS